ncbi:MAG: hypothetical protein H6741_01515 [Alphaproteobacteria bacterium]|nr:hypothetical protein [Alphaproteobacteria bacterium]
MKHEAPPDRARAAWRRAEPWLAALVALCLALIALRWRLDALPHAAVDKDWAWFLRVARQQAWGQAWSGPGMFMYPTPAPLAFGLLGRLTGSGGGALLAWTALAALAAPVCFLATRRLAGIPAGVLAALTLMVSATQAWLGVGLKSPYLISLASAGVALGLTVGARRVWAPAWTAFWATAMLALHVGTALGAALAVALSLGMAWRLPRGRTRRLGGLAWLAAALPIPARILTVDLERLLADARLHTESGGILDTAPAALLRLRVEDSLSLGLAHVPWLAGLGALGFLAFLVQLRRRDAAWRRRGWAAAAVTAVGLAGVAPYLYQLRALDYFEVHHLAGLVPLLLVGLAGLVRAAAPPGWGALGALAAALTLLPWYLDARGGSGTLHGVIEGRHSVGTAMVLEGHVRAASPGQDPLVLGFVSREPDKLMFARTLGELVQVGPWTEGLPPTCFVLSDSPTLSFLTAEPALHPEGTDWWLFEDPGCRALQAASRTLCSPEAARTLALREDFGQLRDHPPAEWRLLPRCYR